MNLAFALFTYSSHSGLSRDAVAIARACEEGGHRVRVYAGEIRDGGLRAAGWMRNWLRPRLARAAITARTARSRRGCRGRRRSFRRI